MTALYLRKASTTAFARGDALAISSQNGTAFFSTAAHSASGMEQSFSLPPLTRRSASPPQYQY